MDEVSAADIAELGISQAELTGLEALSAYRERDEADEEAATGGPEAAVLELPAAANPGAKAQAAAARISPRAVKMIIDYETGGRGYYERVIKSRPIWPKEKSGVTIGFGYDLGYVGLAEYRRDWAGLIAILSASQRAALEACVGFHSGKDSEAKMNALISSVRDIIVTWEISEPPFKTQTMPKFALMTENAVPNCAALNGDCFGVLVSLTFNRGASYSTAHNPVKDPKDRYREMRAIKAAMGAREFSKIPGLIENMVRIWKGTAVEDGLKRRRLDEAALFRAGLAAGLPLETPISVLGEGQAEAAGGHELPPGVDSINGETDEDFWQETSDDDLAEGALENAFVGIAATGATWAADAVQPDYAHLGEGLQRDLPFQFRPDDLALLARLNDFDLAELGDDTPVLFGLRGAGIVKDHTAGDITLIDQRPDHLVPRCTIGVWDRKTNAIAVFPGSTVPNQSAVISFRNNGEVGNLLATGLYHYVCGAHVTSRTTPGCFLLRKPDLSKRVVVVRRSRDDLSYQKTDIVDRCAPGDNIHPTFFSGPSGFSSLGCQTVVGTFKDGAHSGPWADFRKAAGFLDKDGEPGKRFLYMLVTGAEVRIAGRLRRDGLERDAVALRRLRRLRFGSASGAVQKLQQRLNAADPGNTFGPFTAESLHRFQAGMAGAKGSDGIYTPELDAALGWQVFGSLGL